MIAIRTVAAACALLVVPGEGSAQPQNRLELVREWETPRDFTGKKSEPKAYDLSGIACVQLSSARRCLVVNDENRFGQFADAADGRLVAGPRVGLIGKKADPKTHGSEPVNRKDGESVAPASGAVASCPKDDDFEDLDGEGVTFATPYFYVVGSHGCSRKSGKFRLSSFVLARIKVDNEGRVIGPDGKVVASPDQDSVLAETTYRLTDALSKAEPVGEHFGKDLGSMQGVNVEGIAIIGDQLFAGLRAPSLAGRTYLVTAKVSELFAPGKAPLPSVSKPIPVALGNGIGIRDLAPLADGRLLILAGPSADQDGTYVLYATEPREGAAPTRLGELEGVKGKNAEGEVVDGKAEAVLVLREEPLHVLVLFDGIANGGPREYRYR